MFALAVTLKRIGFFCFQLQPRYPKGGARLGGVLALRGGQALDGARRRLGQHVPRLRRGHVVGERQCGVCCVPWGHALVRSPQRVSGVPCEFELGSREREPGGVLLQRWISPDGSARCLRRVRARALRQRNESVRVLAVRRGAVLGGHGRCRRRDVRSLRRRWHVRRARSSGVLAVLGGLVLSSRGLRLQQLRRRDLFCGLGFRLQQLRRRLVLSGIWEVVFQKNPVTKRGHQL